jgi:carboxylesterase
MTNPSDIAAPKPLHLAAGAQAVLLFHGLSSAPQELQFLARGLHRAGYTVRVPVLRGYSFGTAGVVPAGHRQWVADALAEFDALRQTHAFVAVGGLCIGAVLALRVAAMRAGTVAGLLGLSTTLHYDGWATPWTRRLLPLARLVPGAGRIAVREKPPFGLKDERMRGFIERQMRELGASEAGAALLRVRDLLQARRLIAAARQGLEAITAPALLVHAREDDAAAPRSAFEVATRIASARVRCVLLNDSYHMISIDREKHLVLAEMLEFLERERQGSRHADGPSNLFLLDRARLRST